MTELHPMEDDVDTADVLESATAMGTTTGDPTPAEVQPGDPSYVEPAGNVVRPQIGAQP